LTGQAALHPDLRETESDSRGARTAVWDESVKCEQVDSRVTSRIESGLSGPRTATSPHRRRVRCEVQDACDGRKSHHPPFWHDGTERPIHRPIDPEEQQEYYSGKKKCHTIKNLLVIDETCHIGFLSATYEGKVNDKTLADLEGYTLPHGSCLYQDMGFQGFILTGSTIVQPKKKPRGGELTPSEQATNRTISSISIRIAHTIGGMKRYRMVKDKIRLLKDGIRDTIMETCSGLQNFRLQYRPWHYAN
jgi:DDE superfamily endonuclease